LWLEGYLREVERQNDRTPGDLPLIGSWAYAVADFEKWPEDRLPCMVLITPGSTAGPTADGDGLLTATWSLRAAAVVSANTEENTREIADLYADATKAAIVHHQTLGGFALATDLVGDTNVSIGKKRSMAVAEVAFNVTVDGVLDRFAGPATPPVNPLADPGDWPTALTAEATVDRLDPDS
jgi:hypothetical protein